MVLWLKSIRVLSIITIDFLCSSHFHVEALGPIDIPGTVNSQFIHIVSNVSIDISGMIKSQRSDCITEDLSHDPVLLNKSSYF